MRNEVSKKVFLVLSFNRGYVFIWTMKTTKIQRVLSLKGRKNINHLTRWTNLWCLEIQVNSIYWLTNQNSNLRADKLFNLNSSASGFWSFLCVFFLSSVEQCVFFQQRRSILMPLLVSENQLSRAVYAHNTDEVLNVFSFGSESTAAIFSYIILVLVCSFPRVNVVIVMCTGLFLSW